MDVTEYDVMRENAALLKDALSREKELNKEIDRLNKERIEDLEKSKYTVTMITETRHYELVYLPYGEMELGRRLHDVIRRADPHSRGRGPGYGSSYDTNSLQSALGYEGKTILEHCFEKKEISHEPIRTVVRKGFDEVVEQIKREHNAKLDQNVKDTLAEIKETRSTKYADTSKIKELNNGLSDLQKKYEDNLIVIEKLDKENGRMSIEISQLPKKVELFIKQLTFKVNRPLGILNMSSYRSNILKHVNGWKQ